VPGALCKTTTPSAAAIAADDLLGTKLASDQGGVPTAEARMSAPLAQAGALNTIFEVEGATSPETGLRRVQIAAIQAVVVWIAANGAESTHS
jgi:hypothetical protein